jgi:hypothetical protein
LKPKKCCAALKRKYDSHLARLYGLVRGSDPARQLQTAEGWLKEHPADPSLLLTLGRLCLQNSLWGKARDYLESSLRCSATRKPVPSWRGCWRNWVTPSAATSCSRKVWACWMSACWRAAAGAGSRLTVSEGSEGAIRWRKRFEFYRRSSSAKSYRATPDPLALSGIPYTSAEVSLPTCLERPLRFPLP